MALKGVEQQQQRHEGPQQSAGDNSQLPAQFEEFDNENSNTHRACSRFSVRHFLLLIPVLCVGSVLLTAAVIMTNEKDQYQTTTTNDGWESHLSHANQEPLEFDQKEIRRALFTSIDTARMSSTLHKLTKEAHPAGTEPNRRVAEYLVELWKQNGLEQVQMLEYDVLLSYPNWTNPNHVSVLSAQDEVLFKTLGLSPDLMPPDGGGNDYHAAIQWLAFSGDGTVEGEPVYCHYGRREDFARLEKEFGISDLNGKIAVIRYGKLFRGDKVKHAKERNASAVILFSDPIEVAPTGKVFPETDNLPGVGVQRGSLMMGVDGDATTPLLPSRHDFYRQKTAQQLIDEGRIAAMPVLPIGYSDAKEILKRMAGPAVPAEWQGGIDVPYRVGPGFVQDQGSKVRVEVHAELDIKTIQNVIGVIRGREEPDSWVMLGNHYDAWTFGSIDPNSGTAIMTEVARAFVESTKRGWRPRRSLVFCAWDAEEYALIGSTEFVQEYADVLKERAVVYLNVDLIAGNKSLILETVPTLYKAVTDAAKLVRNPMAEDRAKGRRTVYDSWRYHYPPDISWLPDTPHIDVPGGGSDHMSFLNFLGIPVVDFTYRNPAQRQYPLYHSRYELPFANERLFDHENLAVHKAVGEYWAELARSFADSPVLPLNAGIFARRLLKDYFGDVRKAVLDLYAKYPNEMELALQQMQNLLRQTQLFLQQTVKFEEDLELAEPDWANRRLRKLDQCFLNPAMGLAAKEPSKRHLLFSLSADDTYSASVMAAVQQQISAVARQEDAQQRAESGRQLALELTVVQNAVLCATNTLKSFL